MVPGARSKFGAAPLSPSLRLWVQRPIAGPLAWVLVEICIAFVYSNQNINKTATKYSYQHCSRKIRPSILGLITESLSVSTFILLGLSIGPGYDVPLVPLPIGHVYKSQVHCSGVMQWDELAIHSWPLLCPQGQLVAKLASGFFTVSLYCITITWQQIFWFSLQVTILGGLRHVTVERGHLGR